MRMSSNSTDLSFAHRCRSEICEACFCTLVTKTVACHECVRPGTVQDDCSIADVDRLHMRPRDTSPLVSASSLSVLQAASRGTVVSRLPRHLFHDEPAKRSHALSHDHTRVIREAHTSRSVVKFCSSRQMIASSVMSVEHQRLLSLNSRVTIHRCLNTLILSIRGRSIPSQALKRAAIFMFVRTVVAKVGSHFISGFSWIASHATLPVLGLAATAFEEEAAYCSVPVQTFGSNGTLMVFVGIVCFAGGFCDGLLEGGYTRAQQTGRSGVKRWRTPSRRGSCCVLAPRASSDKLCSGRCHWRGRRRTKGIARLHTATCIQTYSSAHH